MTPDEQGMDDVLVQGLWREPPERFARDLRKRLRAQEAPSSARPQRRVTRAAGIVAMLVVAVGALAVPEVRASAHAFLSMFRVVNFVAVPVNDARVDKFKAIDLPRLVGEGVQVVENPGPPLDVASPDAAAATAGYAVRQPASLPEGSRIIQVAVQKERALRVTADAARLQQVMDALGITDLRVPQGLDGQTVNVRVPPVVMIRYEHGKRHTRLFQSLSPQIALPAGVEPAALGEIALRILGLTREDARHFAGSVDWSTTLLVPLPPTTHAFRQVNIAGHPGIAVEARPPDAAPTNIVLWSADGRVFGIVSVEEMTDVLEMANSIK